jgi:signal recognition particle subunit SRP54
MPLAKRWKLPSVGRSKSTWRPLTCLKTNDFHFEFFHHNLTFIAMFSSLSDSLDNTFRNLRGVGRISEKNVADALREIRIALLEADVEFGVAKDFISKVKEKALGEDVLKSIKPGEQIVKIFHDELEALLGGDQTPLDLNPPARILICGLNGAGKTTTAAKLANRLKKEGRRPLLIACDLYRPAAIDQLAVLAKQIDVPVYTPDASETDVVKVAREALIWAETQQGTVLIFDTAGRQEIDLKLIAELKRLHDFLKPKETLLVADSATGQQAVSVAQHFDDAVGITGIILTKLDGDARGGAALSMRAVTGKPIKYAGEGEKLDQLFEFHPSRMADRILGMGDIVGMVEQVADKVNEADAMRSMKRMQEGKFDFTDFLDQMKMIQNLGPLEGLLGLMPGFSKIKKQLPAGAFDTKKLKRTEAIVLSMTLLERTRPEIIKGSRRQRIADGSGTNLMEVNQLIKQFGEMRKMMKSPTKMGNMMKQMGGASGMKDMMKGLGGGKFPF